MEDSASPLQMFGAGGFGTIVGWYIYYLIRHRTDKVSISDLSTIVGVIGGGAVLTLFPAKTDLFGAYGIGLFLGFFGYLVFLLAFVAKSSKFDIEWFLDGRRKTIAADETDTGNVPMSAG
jgi:hypothetical protein